MSRADNLAFERLKSFIERIEKLEEERAALGADAREVYAEAKSAGFDVKPLRIVIKRRKMEPAERNELDEVVDIYEQAVNGKPVLEEARQARDERVRALLGEGKSVRQIEKATGVPKSEVQRIRAELAGEIRQDVSQSLGQSQEAVTDSDAELSQDLGQGIEAEVPQVAVPALGRLVLTSGDRLGRGLASLDPGPIPDFLVRAEPAKSEAP